MPVPSRALVRAAMFATAFLIQAVATVHYAWRKR